MSFREVASRLPIVYDTLEATRKYIQKHPANGSSDGLKSTIEACETRANHLRDIFEKAAPPDKEIDSPADRYLKAVTG